MASSSRTKLWRSSSSTPHVVGVLGAHPEQGLDDTGHARERAGAAGAVHVAGMAVAAALGRLGGVMDQQHRARTLAGDVAEHRGHALDLLVGVLADLVGLDERVHDEQADAVTLDVLDAAIDVGQADDVAGAVGLGHQQRPVGTTIHGEAVAQLAQGHVPVLQDGREPAPHLVAVVLVVVDPGGRRLVHGLAGEFAAGRHRHRLLEGEGGLADPARRHPQRQLAAQQRAAEQPAATRQHGHVQVLDPARLQRQRRLVVEAWFRVGNAPLAPGALDHPRHLAAGLGHAIAFERQALRQGQDLGVGPAAADPMARQPDQIGRASGRRRAPWRAGPPRTRRPAAGRPRWYHRRLPGRCRMPRLSRSPAGRPARAGPAGRCADVRRRRSAARSLRAPAPA